MAAKSETVKFTLKITSIILHLLLNVIFYILVTILIINCSKQVFSFTYQLYGPVTVDKEPGREIIIKIIKGDSTMDVASKLEVNRAIVNKYSFYLKTKLQDKVIMPGTYVIKSSMTYGDILNIITDASASIVQKKKQEIKQQDTGQDSQSTLPDTDQKTKE